MSAQDKLIEARRLVSEVQREVTDATGKASLLYAASEINTALAVLNHNLPTESKPVRDPFNCDIRR
jgi:hypothetical protein